MLNCFQKFVLPFSSVQALNAHFHSIAKQCFENYRQFINPFIANVSIALRKICQNMGVFWSCFPVYRYMTLRKICQNMSFLWPAFARVRMKGNVRVNENLYSGIFYAVSCKNKLINFLYKSTNCFLDDGNICR